MAPELFQLKPVYSPASDMYGYGTMLWELAARAIPFAQVASIALVGTFVVQGSREDIPADTPAAFLSLIARSW